MATDDIDAATPETDAPEQPTDDSDENAEKNLRNLSDISKWVANLTTGAVSWVIINARPSTLFCPESLKNEVLEKCLRVFAENVYSVKWFWPTTPQWLTTVTDLTDIQRFQAPWNFRLLIFSIFLFLLSILCSIIIRMRAARKEMTDAWLLWSQVILVGLGGLAVLGLSVGTGKGQEQLSLKVDWGTPPKITFPTEIKPVAIRENDLVRLENIMFKLDNDSIMKLKEVEFGVKKPTADSINLEVSLKKGESVGIDKSNNSVRIDDSSKVIAAGTVGVSGSVTATGAVTVKDIEGAFGEKMSKITSSLGAIEDSVKDLNPSRQSRSQAGGR